MLRAAAVAVAAFSAGAVLLGVEIAASRVLAPFFGNSLFVWGALIGVVLAGLAVGYWVGGTIADRFPRPVDDRRCDRSFARGRRGHNRRLGPPTRAGRAPTAATRMQP